MSAPIVNQDWYLVTKDALTVTLAIAGLVVAFSGLATWKKQLKGSKEFEVAYNLNYSVLKIRNAVDYVRNIAIWIEELEKAKRDYRKENPEISGEALEKMANIHVYKLRWEKILDARSEMQSHLLGAEALWGKDIILEVQPIYDIINRLNANLYEYSIGQQDGDYKRIEASRKVVQNQGSTLQPDEFSKELNVRIESIRDFFKARRVL